MSPTICSRCMFYASWGTAVPISTDNAFIFARRALLKNPSYRFYALTTFPASQIRNRRYASSSPSSSSPSLSSASSKKNKQLKTSPSKPPTTYTVNPPVSTLPAELNLPPKTTSTSNEPFSKKISRFLAIGRAFLSFYKTGLKNVYSNYKASLPIRRSLGLPLYIPTSLPFGTTRSITPSASGSATATATAVETLQITRADFQLAHRAAHDVRRMIPFGILLIVCGELTPLVVLAVGDAVVPYTCRVPRQVEKTRMLRLRRKQSAFAAVQGGLGSVTPIRPGSREEMDWLATQFGDREFVAGASAEQVLRACAVFGLVRTHERASVLVPLAYRKRLARWTEYLELDDRLIVRGGGVDGLSTQEVRIAVEERGGVGVGSAIVDASTHPEKIEKEERQWLSDWLKRRNIA